MDKTFNKILKTLFFVFAICFIVFVAVVFVKGLCARTAHVSRLNDGWMSEDGEAVVLPEKMEVPAGRGMTLSRRLPVIFDAGISICFRSSQQEVRVWLDGQMLYQYRCPMGQLLSHAAPGKWNFIDIPEGSGRSVLDIEMVSPYKAYSGVFSDIYYGDSLMLYTAVYEWSLPVLMLSVLMLVFGMFLCSVYLLVNRYMNVSNILWMGMVLILFGIWSLMEAEPMSWPMGFERYVTTITCWAFMLIPIPFIFYLQKEWKGAGQRGLSILAVLSILNIVGCNLLQFTGVRDLMEMSYPTHALVIAAVIYGCVWEVRRFLIAEVSGRRFRFGIAVFFYGSVIMELVLHYCMDFYYTGTVLRGGTLIFAWGLTIVTVLEIAEHLSRDAQTQEQLQKSRVKLMMRQMQPHFLYNSLYAIQALCYTEPREAANAIVLFSKYLRANMECLDHDELISSSKELEHIENYIKIQKMCFGDELAFEKHWTAKPFQIPPLTIQPFVENAIRHGIRKRRGRGTVILSSRDEGCDVVVTVEDDGVGYDVSAPLPEDGFHSTDNVRFRLETLVGATVLVESEPGRGTRVTIRIPARRNREEQGNSATLKI